MTPMIVLDPFDPKEHGKHFELLVDMRNIDPVVLTDIPELGVIAQTVNQDPIAIGFLRRVEGHYGLMDSYISNPNMPAHVRNEALDLITKELIAIGEQVGMIKVFAFSLDKNIVQRAQKHGFYLIPFQFLALNLRGEICHS